MKFWFQLQRINKAREEGWKSVLDDEDVSPNFIKSSHTSQIPWTINLDPSAFNLLRYRLWGHP